MILIIKALWIFILWEIRSEQTKYRSDVSQTIVRLCWCAINTRRKECVRPMDAVASRGSRDVYWRPSTTHVCVNNYLFEPFLSLVDYRPTCPLTRCRSIVFLPLICLPEIFLSKVLEWSPNSLFEFVQSSQTQSLSPNVFLPMILSPNGLVTMGTTCGRYCHPIV